MADPLISVVRVGSGSGTPGPKGDTGATGPAGPSVFIPGEDGEEGQPGPMGLTGPQGATGSAGTPGATGATGPAVFLEAESIEGEPGTPGARGADGAAGSVGQTGVQGPAGPAVFLEAEAGEDGWAGLPFLVPPLGWTHFTQDLGASKRSGTFDITGLSGISPDQHVDVMQTARAIASKGNARDEFEMDAIQLTGYVVDTATIRCYWNAPGVVVGTYAFAYLVNT